MNLVYNHCSGNNAYNTAIIATHGVSYDSICLVSFDYYDEIRLINKMVWTFKTKSMEAKKLMYKQQ